MRTKGIKGKDTRPKTGILEWTLLALGNWWDFGTMNMQRAIIEYMHVLAVLIFFDRFTIWALVLSNNQTSIFLQFLPNFFLQLLLLDPQVYWTHQNLFSRQVWFWRRVPCFRKPPDSWNLKLVTVSVFGQYGRLNFAGRFQVNWCQENSSMIGWKPSSRCTYYIRYWKEAE